MIPVPRPHKTSPLILLLVALLGIIGGYIYYTQIGASGEDLVQAAPGANDSSFLRFKTLKLDFSLLDTAPFSNLKTYGDIPIQSSVGTRDDIFNP
ncbi:MAG: hypothetical protein A3A33_03405 [Candidatus Yanofskybacteria bacterium RIFCSPLOWO2_01_FULL_49_25]|uniref:Uncharacterized protein n=1 Tax=Candidatus Yanofskybacteria bacterium RIFCSPLOWO2_01_FULL_49_25 TaxID=1802701 RepID=A0A1F8GU31_9BACT|nr:MAG: hypothetical protein A3A33_03405 [Candidatus Yanofskybacteria bacterium RIFCSPLOWO2_01_FULL_49_25]